MLILFPQVLQFLISLPLILPNIPPRLLDGGSQQLIFAVSLTRPLPRVLQLGLEILEQVIISTVDFFLFLFKFGFRAMVTREGVLETIEVVDDDGFRFSGQWKGMGPVTAREENFIRRHAV